MSDGDAHRQTLPIPSVIETLEKHSSLILRNDGRGAPPRHVNPAAARDELHRMFKDRAITLELGDDGVYVGKSELDLSVVFKMEGAAPYSEAALTGCGSGGRICRRSSSGRLDNPVVP